MQAGVAQLAGIHHIEVGGIMKIGLHDCKITHHITNERMICAKSENYEVICETMVPKKRCTFAA